MRLVLEHVVRTPVLSKPPQNTNTEAATVNQGIALVSFQQTQTTLDAPSYVYMQSYIDGGTIRDDGYKPDAAY